MWLRCRLLLLYMFICLSQVTSSNVSVALVDTTPVGTHRKYVGGGALTGTKLIYCGYSTERLGIMDTASGLWTATSVGGLGTHSANNFYFVGQVAIDDGVLCVPYNKHQVGIYNASTNTYETIQMLNSTGNEFF